MPNGAPGQTGATGQPGPTGATGLPGGFVAKDANGNVVGTVLSVGGTEITVTENDGTIQMFDANTGAVVYPGLSLYFADANCQGTAYTSYLESLPGAPVSAANIDSPGDPLYTWSGAAKVTATVQSETVGERMHQHWKLQPVRDLSPPAGRCHPGVIGLHRGADHYPGLVGPTGRR
ncbi:MAG: hypothetical protein WCD11_19610 [Solirubrobacteraceae bacterium]